MWLKKKFGDLHLFDFLSERKLVSLRKTLPCLVPQKGLTCERDMNYNSVQMTVQSQADSTVDKKLFIGLEHNYKETKQSATF